MPPRVSVDPSCYSPLFLLVGDKQLCPISTTSLSRCPAAHQALTHGVSQPWARASEIRSSNTSFFLNSCFSQTFATVLHTCAQSTHTHLSISHYLKSLLYLIHNSFLKAGHKNSISHPSTSNPHFCLRDRWSWRKPPSSSPGALSPILAEWMYHR